MQTTDSATTVFVTGASRGIGFEFVSQLLRQSNTVVYAAARSPTKATALQALAGEHKDKLIVVDLDVTNEDQVKEVAQKLEAEGVPLDILINNAAMGGKEGFLELTKDDFLSVLNVNVVGPYLVTKYLLPSLRKGQKKVIINIGSTAGSSAITLQPLPAAFAGMEKFGLGYKVSKAALHNETAFFATNLGPEGFTVVSIHPGWVATDMGKMGGSVIGFDPSLTTEKSVAGMLKVMGELDPSKHNGKIISYEGDELPF